MDYLMILAVVAGPVILIFIFLWSLEQTLALRCDFEKMKGIVFNQHQDIVEQKRKTGGNTSRPGTH